MTPERLTAWREAIGGRRFILCLGCGAICTLLLWFGRLDGESFKVLILGTIGVYVAGSTYQKVHGNAPTA